MILVTGSAGQLGSELKLLLSRDEAHFFDRENCDITNFDQIENIVTSNNITSIINCAAYTAVDDAENESQKAFLINEIGAANLALLAKKYLIPLIHISTDYVFAGNVAKPLHEESETNPSSVYGKSKLAGEKKILEIRPNGIIIRTSWLYSSFGKNFVKTILKLGSEKDSLNIVYDQIGTPTSARDLAMAIVKILPMIKNEVCDVYHYSDEGVASWFDFAQAICELKDLKCEINPIESHQYPTLAPRPTYSVLSKDKIRAKFGLNIQYWRKSLVYNLISELE